MIKQQQLETALQSLHVMSVHALAWQMNRQEHSAVHACIHMYDAASQIDRKVPHMYDV
jgi:hypothetical protein